jgi:hypothetical protein
MKASTQHDPLLAERLAFAFPWIAVGPNVTLLASLRTEHFLIYGLALAMLFGAGKRRASSSVPPLAPFMALLLGSTVVLAATVASVSRPAFLPAGMMVAGIDNSLMPAAAWLSATWLCTRSPNIQTIARRLCLGIATVGAFNGLFAVVAIYVDTSGVTRWFVPNNPSGTSVAANAATLGRHSGLLNQPLEAGALAALACFSALWLFRERQVSGRLALALGAGAALGGVVSVSKVFLAAGMPILVILIFAAVPRGLRARTVFSFLTVTALSVALLNRFLLSDWAGTQFLLVLLSPGNNRGALSTYSGGRLQSDSQYLRSFGEILDSSPWVGFGFSGINAPYDSLWLEQLAMGGILACVAAGAFFVAYGTSVARAPSTYGPDRLHAWALLVFSVGASIGSPILTANRSGSLVVVLMAILAALLRRDRTPERAERTSAIPRRGQVTRS